MDSGVSEASRSSTPWDDVAVSRVDSTSSAFAWASVTFCSASSMNRLKTSCEGNVRSAHHKLSQVIPYLNSSHVCVLCGILVLVKAVLGEFAFAEVDTEFDKKDHHRLERGDGTVACPFRDDMFVKEGKRSSRLIDSDEFLRALESILGLAMGRRRHAGQPES